MSFPEKDQKPRKLQPSRGAPVYSRPLSQHVRAIRTMIEIRRNDIESECAVLCQAVRCIEHEPAEGEGKSPDEQSPGRPQPVGEVLSHPWPPSVP